MGFKTDSSYTSRARGIVVVSSLLIALGIVSVGQSLMLLSLGFGVLAAILVFKGVHDLRLAALSKMKIEYRAPKVHPENQPLTVELVIANPTHVAMDSLEVIDRYPVYFKLLKGFNSAVVHVPARGRAVLSYTLEPVMGRHSLGPPKLRVGDPLGVYSTTLTLGDSADIMVIPKPEPWIGVGGLYSKGGTPGGTTKLRSWEKGSGVEFYDLRDYVPGDEPRFVDWKAFSRWGRLATKEFEREVLMYVLLAVDVHPSMAYGLIGKTKLEYSLKALSTIADYLISRGDCVGLLLSRPQGFQFVQPSRGKAQLHRILLTLGSLSWDELQEGRSGIIDALRSSVSLIKREKHLFILFTDPESAQPEDLARILSSIRSFGHEVLVAVPQTVLFEARGLDGFEAALYRLKALDELERTAQAQNRLAAARIPAITVGPLDLVSATVSRVEALRGRMI